MIFIGIFFYEVDSYDSTIQVYKSSLRNSHESTKKLNFDNLACYKSYCHASVNASCNTIIYIITPIT